MSFIRLLFKLVVLPFIPALMLLTAILYFMHAVAGGILYTLSTILALLSIATLVTAGGNDLFIRSGIAGLVISFLASPVGLPAAAGWLIDLLDELRYALQGFIMS